MKSTSASRMSTSQLSIGDFVFRLDAGTYHLLGWNFLDALRPRAHELDGAPAETMEAISEQFGHWLEALPCGQYWDREILS